MYLFPDILGDTSASFLDVVNSTMYDLDNFIADVAIFFNPDNVINGTTTKSPFLNWDCLQKQMTESFIHRNYGHCYKLDLASLSTRSNGKFLMAIGADALHLKMMVRISRSDEDLKTIQFMTNGTDVEDLGTSIMPTDLDELAQHVSRIVCRNFI